MSRKNCVKKLVFCWHLEGQWRKKQDPDQDPDPLVRGMDPRIRIRIRIHPKMSWIRNTALNKNKWQIAKKSATHSLPEKMAVFAVFKWSSSTHRMNRKSVPATVLGVPYCYNFMMFVAIKKVEQKIFFPLLLRCCCWIRDPGWQKIRICNTDRVRNTVRGGGGYYLYVNVTAGRPLVVEDLVLLPVVVQILARHHHRHQEQVGGRHAAQVLTVRLLQPR